MVGLSRRHANEAIPADAACEPGRSVRRRPSFAAAPKEDSGPDRRHQSADLQPLLPRKDSVRNGQGGHERADEGPRDGF